MRKTAISSGAALRALLLGNDVIAAAVGDKIFPGGAVDIELPYIAYIRSRFIPRYNGTRPYGTAEYTINVYTDDYEEGVTIAEAVAETVDSVRNRTLGGLMITHGTVTNAFEAYDVNARIQGITIEINVL